MLCCAIQISDEEVKQYIEKSTEESYQTESLTESLTEVSDGSSVLLE